MRGSVEKAKKVGLVGAVFAHGTEIREYVIIPPGMEFCPLAGNSQTLFLREILANIDLYRLHADRLLITPEAFFQSFCAGHVITNVKLRFRFTFDENGPDGTCFTTGIVSKGCLHETRMAVSSFRSETCMRDALMAPHDESIIPKDELWNSVMSIGKVLKLITNAGKHGRYLGMFCRDPSSKDVGVLPKFLTVEMTNEIYHSCFFAKLDFLETCARAREFPELSLVGLEYVSKLMMRVVFTELCAIIRMKLNIDNTISSFEFHSVIEIFHAKRVPLECVMFGLERKLLSLVIGLKTFELRDVVFDAEVVIPSPSFVTGLRLLCIELGANLDIYIVKHKKRIEQVISAAEKAISGIGISTEVHDYIVALIKKIVVMNPK